ncbi:hypothetical protein F2Q68_00038517 [Brassica cretica]|uniref:Uncharacterized protein n=1 Tax=Brassica cretica TaxID=69181 RepID=A0A8S9MI47_BRACR|nr:hypothetical protein F2Q68_00038517 [Brassica cretica]
MLLDDVAASGERQTSFIIIDVKICGVPPAAGVLSRSRRLLLLLLSRFFFPSWLFSYSPAICSTDLEFDGGLYFGSDRGGAEVAGGKRISGMAASRVNGNFREGSALRVFLVSPAVVFKLDLSDLNI